MQSCKDASISHLAAGGDELAPSRQLKVVLEVVAEAELEAELDVAEVWFTDCIQHLRG